MFWELNRPIGSKLFRIVLQTDQDLQIEILGVCRRRRSLTDLCGGFDSVTSEYLTPRRIAGFAVLREIDFSDTGSRRARSCASHRSAHFRNERREKRNSVFLLFFRAHGSNL